MDHLPWQRQDEPRPKVSYMCQQLTEQDICGDLDDFCTWPEQKGWTFDSSVSQKVLATYRQSWLFFGFIRILTEADSSRFSLTGYISPADPIVLNSHSLRRLLQRKNIRVASSRLEIALSIAQRWLLDSLTFFEEANELVTADDEEIFHVLWATAMFLETLENRINYGTERGNRHDRSKTRTNGQMIALRIAGTDAITIRLRRYGRCPALFRQQRLTLGEAWTVFAVPLTPKDIETRQIDMHISCSPRRCNANNITGTRHTKQHAFDCLSGDQCLLKGVDDRVLSDLIRQRAIPLVRSIFDGTSVTIKLVERAAGQEFVAISHVWTGGLGNCEANSMFECQLINIHAATSSTRKLPSTSNYWLDTLCIPVHDVSTKKLAIDEMACIYASAKTVLVLDPTLQYIDANDLEHQQIATLIAVSTWMGRSWTLQEATLARDLKFRFRDENIGFNDVDVGLLRNSQLQTMYCRDVDVTERNIKNIINAPQRLLAIWQELCYRESTKLDDIAAIIAVFIDRSAGEVLDLQPQDRIYALLRSQTLLPTCLLFAPCDTDVVTWKPKLPTVRNAIQMSHSNTFLRFTSDNLLEVSDLQDLYILRSKQPVSTYGSIVVQEEVTRTCFMITFYDPDTKRNGKVTCTLPAATSDMLFVFPQELVNQQKESEHLQAGIGLCFTMLSRLDAPEKATFHRRFLWTVVPAIEMPEHLSSIASSSDKFGQCSAARFPPPEHSTSAEQQCRLLLDMGTYAYCSGP